MTDMDRVILVIGWGNMSRLRALDFFAREGDWQTQSYADKILSLDAWEINPDYEPALRKNLPMANVTIGDSYALAKLPENQGRFDFIFIDNPGGGIFGDGHCEHFDALELVPLLLDQDGYVVFNVNMKPFDYGKDPAWKAAREEYYGVDDASDLSWRVMLRKFYRRKFESLGLNAEWLICIPSADAYGGRPDCRFGLAVAKVISVTKETKEV